MTMRHAIRAMVAILVSGAAISRADAAPLTQEARCGSFFAAWAQQYSAGGSLPYHWTMVTSSASQIIVELDVATPSQVRRYGNFVCAIAADGSLTSAGVVPPNAVNGGGTSQ